MLLAIGLTPAGARAADETPEAHVQAGLALRREHKNLEALDEFRHAYALQATPRARAQIGFAEQALARWVEAEADLHAALAEADDEWVVRNRDAIEAALRTIGAELGWLTIAGARDDARIALDGATLASGAPRRIRVTKGAHTVRIDAADGIGTIERHVEISGGADVELFVVPMTPSSSPSQAQSVASPRSTPPSAQRTAGYALGAVGLVGIATSLVLGGVVLHERSVVRDHCVDRHCDSEGLAAGQIGPTLITGSTIAFIGGVVSLGGGAALVFSAPSPRAPASGALSIRVALP